MTPFYATFGVGHGYAGCYVEILAENAHAARAFMLNQHGDQWGEMYLQDRFVDIGRKHDLYKLATVQQVSDAESEVLVFEVVRQR